MPSSKTDRSPLRAAIVVVIVLGVLGLGGLGLGVWALVRTGSERTDRIDANTALGVRNCEDIKAIVASFRPSAPTQTFPPEAIATIQAIAAGQDETGELAQALSDLLAASASGSSASSARNQALFDKVAARDCHAPRSIPPSLPSTTTK